MLVLCEYAIAHVIEFFCQNQHIAYFSAYNGISNFQNVLICRILLHV